jgi:hypothetical protein
MRLILFCLLIYPGLIYSQAEQKLNAPDGAASDELGGTVAINGNTLISGARLNNDLAAGCGTAYIFRQSGTAWNFEQKLVAGDADANDHFGSSVDIYGNWAIVGANNDDEVGAEAGAAYIFYYNGTAWIEVQKLMASDGAAGDEFGFAVSIYDTVAVVGAYRAEYPTFNEGAAYVFHYNGSSWYQAQKITAQFPTEDDFFGYSVDVHKNRIAIGVYQDDDNGINSGSAYIFSYSASWNVEQKLIASNGSTGDAFGFDVSLNDSLCLIGAYGKTNVFTGAGSAYIFRRTGTAWTQAQQINSPDPGQDDWFGYSIALSGSTLIISSFHDDELGQESGAFFVFRYNGSSWIFEFKEKADDGAMADLFGISCDLDGMNAVAGSPGNDDNGSGSGSVYSFSLCSYAPLQEICMATVNPPSYTENLVLWTKPVTTFIDSFYVYHFNGITNEKIGATDYDSPTEFIDNSANVSASSHTYYVTTLNICGTESVTGAPNETIYLTSSVISPGQNLLSWGAPQGFTFPYYRIWRDTTGTGSYELIAANLTSQLTYTDNTAPLSNPDVSYYIEIQRASSCNSGTTSRNTAISNLSNPYTAGFTDNHPQDNLKIFPNPANNHVTIQLSRTISSSIEIIDATGRIVLTLESVGENFTIDISELNAGIYFIRVRCEEGIFVKKFVIEK